MGDGTYCLELTKGKHAVVDACEPIEAILYFVVGAQQSRFNAFHLRNLTTPDVQVANLSLLF